MKGQPFVKLITRTLTCAALVAALAACGGDDDTADTTEAPTTGVVDTTTTEVPETTDAPDTTTTEVPETTDAPETTTTEAPETTEVPDTTPDPGDGVEVTGPDGDFVVVFPGEPEPMTEEVPLPDGTVVTAEILAYETFDAALMVSWTDYPEEIDVSDTDAVLEGSRDGAIGNIGAELTDSEMITLDGNPGIAFSGDVPLGGIDGEYSARNFIVGQRLYQIVVVGAGDGSADELGPAFMDSFAFTGEAVGETG